MLKLQNINYSYHEAHKVLNDINFGLKPGEIIAVAGRNGSGKTTLTRILMGIMNADSGSIELLGKDVTQATPADMARHIGYVFQNPDRQLFAASVREEIAYAPKQLGFSDAKLKVSVEEAIVATELSGFEDESPQLLSRGLKQRLSIASALAAKPKILILDEPTTGQDCRERTILLRLMRKFNQAGMAIVLVTHDMDIIAEHAHKMIVLEKGIIKFNGTPRELFADEALTLSLGLELPETVLISKELGLNICLTPGEIYTAYEKRDMHG